MSAVFGLRFALLFGFGVVTFDTHRTQRAGLLRVLHRRITVCSSSDASDANSSHAPGGMSDARCDAVTR